MSQERPLQELPCVSVQGSMWPQTLRSSKRKAHGCPGEGLGTESTPSELIQQWSPLHKHQRVCKGKENEGSQFVLARRSRRRKEALSGLSWDHLPDELLLRILFYLPLQDLLRMAVVCKRWHRLVFDESLWHSVDLEGLAHIGPALEQLLTAGVQRLRCPRSFIEELQFTDTSAVRVVQMDLSSCTITPSTLENIVCRCRMLECLSLEGLQLSDHIIHSLAKNPNMLQLNLSGCSGFSASPLGEMFRSFSRMEQLNISWCDFSSDHVKEVSSNLHSSVTHLNFSGYRQNLTLEDVKVLVARCPNIEILDLSDSALLMADSFPVLAQLKNLLHLSLSRCYQIHPAALADFSEKFPALRVLDVFGLVQESHVRSLKKGMPHMSINSRPFSTVARPTPAPCDRLVYSECAMWNGRCRLRFKL
ncbi:S-phase kinase-associated protein 2 isoform X2 [Myripristis murdjan]|uniref:S-phase kinase-associated protein 2 isoform X2 n=1 Tax=Myripristis murdjan TaxID=586833 RepID=UPI001175E140|nr:S-phase kinase-associated protein 2 isoform X2 [Myripristis murdjan]